MKIRLPNTGSPELNLVGLLFMAILLPCAAVLGTALYFGVIS